MKTKNLLLALTLPMAFAACSNEEFMDNSAIPTNNNLVELGEGFVLAGQGTSETSTRGAWGVEGKNIRWSWLPELLVSGGNSTIGTSTGILNVEADKIGLCSTGEYPDGTGSISDKVLTNYEFIHNGWLAKGEKSAEFNECKTPFELKNGKTYADIVVGSLATTSTVDQIKTQLGDAANKVTISGTDKELDLNSGTFKTSNKAIFGGSYIVYYPYNEKFADVAGLPATSPAEFADVTTGTDLTVATHVAKNTFMVGYAKNLIGGSQASKFGLEPLSGIVALQLKQAGTAKTINKVALWSQDGFVTSVSLDASKIKSMSANGGEALYIAGTKKTTSTIVAGLKTATALSPTVYTNIYLPVLPTTAKGLKVIVYANDKSVAIMSVADLAVGAGSAKTVKVDMAEADFKENVLVAVDEATLRAFAETATYTEATTVQVIGDITLAADLNVKANVIVEGGKIIVPEGIVLTLEKDATIKSTVEIQGQTCCGVASAGGKMVVQGGATVAGNVNALAGFVGKAAGTIEFGYTIDTPSKVASSSKIVSDGTIDFKGVTDIRGTLTLNAGSTATLSADASDVNVKGGTIINNGKFAVNKGKFAMLNANGETVAAAGQNFKNNGTFIDNIGTTIGGGTQYMEFGENGDYICKVDCQARLEEAYARKTACSTIQFVNTTTTTYDLKNAQQHTIKSALMDVNVIDAGTATVIKNGKPSAAVTIGNLTVNAGSALTVNADSAIQIAGDIVLDGKLSTVTDVQNMTATNLFVNGSGEVVFANRDTKNGITLNVSGTIQVVKGGQFTITAAADGKNVADVTCTKLIEGGTFTGKPRVIE